MIRYSHLALAGLHLVAALALNLPAPVVAATSAPVAEAAPKAAAEPLAREEAAFSPTAVYGERVLTEDTVWRGQVLVTGAVTVAPQATLTVEPGTVVRFKRQGGQAPLLVVQGRIIASGTAEAAIVLGSAFSAPAPGDWQGVMLLGTEKKNILEHCRIEGAQTGIDALFSSVTLKYVRSVASATGMRFQDTLVTMDGGGASDCDTGLSFVESEATLKNVEVLRNRIGLSGKRSSIYLYEGNLSGNRGAAFTCDGGRVKIQGGAMLSNGSGATFLGCEGSVTGAKLARNREYGISLTSSRIKVSGNQIAINGDNGMLVFDGAAVAWDNAIHENAGYDLYNAGTEEFRAPGNRWGTNPPKIYDNNGRGKVLYQPVLAGGAARQ